MFTDKGRLGMFVFLISLIGACALSLAVPQAGLGLNLYEDFSSSAINATKWQVYEFAREIQNGQLRLQVRSSVNTTDQVDNALSFPSPDSVNAIETKVTPLAYNNPQGARPYIFVGGRFFNIGVGAVDQYTVMSLLSSQLAEPVLHPWQRGPSSGTQRTTQASTLSLIPAPSAQPRCWGPNTPSSWGGTQD